MTESIQNDKQFQKDMVFNDFYDEDGNFSKDKLKKYLKERTNGTSKLAIQKVAAWVPLYIFLLLLIIRCVTLLINNNEGDFYILNFVACVFLILLLIALEVIPLVYVGMSIQKIYNENLFDGVKEFRKQFDDVLISECKLCAQTKTPEPLNVYNLYTYKQIQQIERSLIGPDTEVYCYSRYRDDGGIGPTETDEIVTENLIKKGIPYHFVYYENSPGDTEPFKPRNSRETYIDLSKSAQLKNKDAYKQCLDYRIYSNARFDVMIYKQGNSLEGYFCLNFPVDAVTCERCQKGYAARCPLKSAKGSTDKLLYKKIPCDITLQLFQKIVEFEKTENIKDV